MLEKPWVHERRIDYKRLANSRHTNGDIPSGSRLGRQHARRQDFVVHVEPPLRIHQNNIWMLASTDPNRRGGSSDTHSHHVYAKVISGDLGNNTGGMLASLPLPGGTSPQTCWKCWCLVAATTKPCEMLSGLSIVFAELKA